MTLTKADASPTKAFFVRMLTRDITLNDCILDLIDNSIDSAWQRSGSEPKVLAPGSALQGYRVDVVMGRDSFSVRDNCGGITLDDAVEYAFTFGRKTTDTTSDYSVGVYGIGMKRAVFKLGNEIDIRSTFHDADGSRVSFRVPIDVDQWLETDKAGTSWDFDIEPSEPLNEAGVEINVRNLQPEAQLRFEDITYERGLRRTLARDYLLPLMQGLTLTINQREVEPEHLGLATGAGFEPMRDRYEDGSVSVEIIAGMSSMPPDNVDPEEGSNRSDDTSGWFVACNGRMVLTADRTSITGWGAQIPRWHPQYSGFVGIVLFTSADPSLLPMTTTKRSVDPSSAVYRRALARMTEPARAWINYTNIRKNAQDQARADERATRSMPLESVAPAPALAVPKLTPGPTIRVANINYAVSLSRLQQLRQGFGDVNLTYRDVGLRSFDYAYDELVDESGA